MRHAIGILAAAVLAASPPIHAQQSGWQERLKEQLRNENVSRAVGSIAGALLGSQIGDGRGRIAAIAAGTIAGYWLGGRYSEKLNTEDRVGIASATERAISTGQTSTWANPDTGMHTRVSVSEAPGGAGARLHGKVPSLDTLPAIELANSYYQPTVNLNVRGGPGTDYRVLYTLKEGERVPVVGRVVDSDWLLIAEDGRASGFAYGPMMALSEDRAGFGNAIRDSMLSQSRPARYQVDASNCRRVTQEVILGDGTADANSFTVCQQPDGSWVEA